VKQVGSRDMALYWRVLALGCAVVLAVLSLWPADELVRVGMGYINDKVGHFLAYVALAWLLGCGWPRQPLWLIWLVSFLFGVAMEYAQSFTLSRQFDLIDMVANGGGALLGVLLLWWRRR
jgi:glycopeptide antibiotics resistance protein